MPLARTLALSSLTAILFASPLRGAKAEPNGAVPAGPHGLGVRDMIAMERLADPRLKAFQVPHIPLAVAEQGDAKLRPRAGGGSVALEAAGERVGGRPVFDEELAPHVVEPFERLAQLPVGEEPQVHRRRRVLLERAEPVLAGVPVLRVRDDLVLARHLAHVAERAERAAIEILQDRLDQRRLAGADFTGQRDQSFATANAVEQGSKKAAKAVKDRLKELQQAAWSNTI